jgi:hypothetical protein
MKKLSLILVVILPSLFSTAMASIVGSWYFVEQPIMETETSPGWAGGPVVITFMDNGQFVFGQDGVPTFDETNGEDGMEYGTYSYDGSEITTSVELDTNRGWGLNDGTVTPANPGTSSFAATLAGNILSIPSGHPTPGQDPYSFSRVTSTSIVGGWKLDGPTDDESIVITFLDGGDFMLVHGNNLEDDSGQAGIEYGEYTWNSETGAFGIILSSLTDTNGEFGLSHSGISNLSLGVGGNSMIATLNDGTASLSRISAVPVPAAVWLFGSGLIGLLGMAKRKKA